MFYTWNEAKKKAKEQFTRDKHIRWLVNFLVNKQYAVGDINNKVKAKLNFASWSTGKICLISTMTDRQYQRLATLSSKSPLANGKSLWRTCSNEETHVSDAAAYSQNGHQRIENVAITVIPNAISKAKDLNTDEAQQVLSKLKKNTGA